MRKRTKLCGFAQNQGVGRRWSHFSAERAGYVKIFPYLCSKQSKQNEMGEKKKGKVLIIDDNEDILFALNLLLKPLVEDIRVELQARCHQRRGGL